MANYTKEIHAKRLLTILQKQNGPCNYCPALAGFTQDRDVLKKYSSHQVCNVCQDFVGANRCPCDFFGSNKATKLSWEALEKEGYLK